MVDMCTYLNPSVVELILIVTGTEVIILHSEYIAVDSMSRNGPNTPRYANISEQVILWNF